MYRLSVGSDIESVTVHPGADGDVVAILGLAGLMTMSPSDARTLAHRLLLAANAAETPPSTGTGNDGHGGGQ